VGGDTMPTYKDLVELARICLRRAGASQDPGESAALFQLAPRLQSPGNRGG
jgi:hypothetical protein